MAENKTRAEKLAEKKANNYGVDLKVIHQAPALKERPVAEVPFNRVENSLKDFAKNEEKKPNKYAEIAESYMAKAASVLSVERLSKKLEETQKKNEQLPVVLHKLAKDSGDALTTTSDKKEVAQSIAAAANAKGWTQINITGSESFRKEVWIEATARGIKVDGYAHTQQDQNDANKRAIEIEKKNRFPNSLNSIQNTSSNQQNIVTKAPANSNHYAEGKTATNINQQSQATNNQQAKSVNKPVTKLEAQANKPAKLQAGLSR